MSNYLLPIQVFPFVPKAAAAIAGLFDDAKKTSAPTSNPPEAKPAETAKAPEPSPEEVATDRLKNYLKPGQKKRIVENVDSETKLRLAQALTDMEADLAAQNKSSNVSFVSGFRTYTEQKSLKRRKGKLAASAGSSNHEVGRAVDLGGLTYQKRKGGRRFLTAAGAWLHANAKKYGLHFRLKHEPWHIEPIGSGKNGKVLRSETLARWDGNKTASPPGIPSVKEAESNIALNTSKSAPADATKAPAASQANRVVASNTRQPEAIKQVSSKPRTSVVQNSSKSGRAAAKPASPKPASDSATASITARTDRNILMPPAGTRPRKVNPGTD